MKGTPSRKRTRAMLAALPPGFSIEKRGAHLSVLTAEGEPLRDERGMPLLVAGTTGEQGSRRDLARVRRAVRHLSLDTTEGGGVA